MIKIIKVIAVILVFASVTLLALYLRQQQLSPLDSDALIGGQLENGYQATGFLVTFTSNTTIEYCGATLLDSRTAVTAAHCLDAVGSRYFGLGEFNTNISNLYPVSSIEQKPGWDRKSSNNDLALFSLSKDVPISRPARLESLPPLVGCGYRVVAYGRDNPDLNSADNDRERKSAEICINNIEGDILVMYSQRGGICLGDSGSPIYIENTNRLVGVVSAVVKANNDSPTCFVGNTAFITRVDTGLSFVAATVGQTKLGEFTSSDGGDASLSSFTSSISRTTTRQVSNTSFSSSATASSALRSLSRTNSSKTNFSDLNSNSSIESTSSNTRINSSSISANAANVRQTPNLAASGRNSENDFFLLVLGVAILLTCGGIIYLALSLRNRR